MTLSNVLSLRALIAFALTTATVAYSPVSLAAPALNNIDADDLNQFMQDFSANSAFTSVSSAASLGSIFGFEVGLIAGASSSPKINTLAQQVDSTANVGLLPNAGLMGALTVPFGITVEATYLPSVSISGVKLARFGGALKWTFTDNILLLPFSMAVRGVYSSTEGSYSQTINNSTTSNQSVNGTVTVGDSVYGLQLLASKDFLFIEPYAGVGVLTANGTASVSAASASTTIFSPSLTSGQSATASLKTTEFFAGVNFKMVFMRFGVEYGRLFDTSRVNAKLSVGF